MGAAGRIWSAAAHPRGPNGRFIKGGGGNSNSTSRPSLAEAVRGTATGGPKRQRADRLAEPVNRPTPAASGRPRPGSAAAMFATGAGKGRIHAATSRPKAAPLSIETVKIEPGGGTRGRLDRMSDEQLERGLLMHGNQSAKGKAIQAEASRRGGPTPAAKAGPAAASRSRDHAAKAEALRLRAGGRQTSTPRGGKVPAAEADIRNAYAELQRMPGDWVPLAELRDRLSGHDRADVDAALESLAMQPGVQLIPWDNRKALTARDHEAALHFGGEENNNLRIEGDQPKAPKPKPRGSAPAPGAAEVGAALSAATTRDQGRAALSGLTVSQLRDVAAANGVTIGSAWTKAKIRDAILQQLVGRRLDSAAIHQMTAPKKSARQIMQAGG